MSSSTNNGRRRRTEHRFYAEIVTDITAQHGTQNIKTHNSTPQNDEQHGPTKNGRLLLLTVILSLHVFMVRVRVILFNSTFNNFQLYSGGQFY